MEGADLFVGKRRISFDDMLMDGWSFKEYALQQYEKRTGKSLPINKAVPWWDIFNGHVEEPGGIIAILLIILLLMAAFSAKLLYDVHDEVTEEELTCVTTKIENYYIEENHMILEPSDLSCKFKLFRYEDYGRSTAEIVSEVKRGKELHIYVLDCEEANNEGLEFEICCVQSRKGKTLLALEEKNKSDKAYNKSCLSLFLIAFFIFLLYCAATVIVGRYPDKFSKRVKRWFFKDGYLHE